ncbi:MAG: alkaline phosphatase family protein, partial [Deltaproteobacteria bacterium]|nr:alkaline phosphatase family protein [Deltaproteobacteria bacterium]
MKNLSARPFWAALLLLSLVVSEPAQAYIGPGAGFALGGSMLVLATTFLLAFAIILTWPIRFAFKLFQVGNPYKNAAAKKVVILGLDGLDPGLATKFMREGRLPNFQKLAERGVFRPLDTSVPSMSPVAWSTFATGTDASHHCIYDFLT